MKKTIKSISITLTIFMLVLCLIGCGNSSNGSNSNSSNGSNSNSSNGSNSNSTKDKITSSQQAINAVKNYLPGTPYSLEQQIAEALHFYTFYPPEYGTCSATQNSDGSWDVTIKGNMSGYIDEYNDDFETYKFEASAETSEFKGDYISISVRRVY